MATRYFGYTIPNTRTNLIGTSIEDIINTIEYYIDKGTQLEIPNPNNIPKLRILRVPCAYEGFKRDQFIDATIEPNVVFRIYANAYDHLLPIVEHYSALDLKRGNLYKLAVGNPKLSGLWYLPQQLMEGLKAHDWKQYEKQIKSWHSEEESAILMRQLLVEEEEKGTQFRQE